MAIPAMAMLQVKTSVTALVSHRPMLRILAVMSAGANGLPPTIQYAAQPQNATPRLGRVNAGFDPPPNEDDPWATKT